MTSRAQPVTSYQDIDELNGSAPICDPPPPPPRILQALLTSLWIHNVVKVTLLYWLHWLLYHHGNNDITAGWGWCMPGNIYCWGLKIKGAESQQLLSVKLNPELPSVCRCGLLKMNCIAHINELTVVIVFEWGAFRLHKVNILSWLLWWWLSTCMGLFVWWTHISSGYIVFWWQLQQAMCLTNAHMYKFKGFFSSLEKFWKGQGN